MASREPVVFTSDPRFSEWLFVGGLQCGLTGKEPVLPVASYGLCVRLWTGGGDCWNIDGVFPTCRGYWTSFSTAD